MRLYYLFQIHFCILKVGKTISFYFYLFKVHDARVLTHTLGEKIRELAVVCPRCTEKRESFGFDGPLQTDCLVSSS